ncbi:MAG: primosomal protein N' [Pseudomonadota bacterium]
MSTAKSATILKVAVNAPLPQCFDYLPPVGGSDAVLPGSRVTVPFGRRRQTGVVLDVASESALPSSKLRRAERLIDDQPLLNKHDLWLIKFVSDYYHHPIGECVAAALPSLLRQGRPVDELEVLYELTPQGLAVELETLKKKAPRQAATLAALAGAGPLPNAKAVRTIPGWSHVKRSLVDKEWIAERQVAAVDQEGTGIATPTAGPPLNPEQRVAVQSIQDEEGFAVHLLDGITGSGKTEVYLQVIIDVIRAGHQVLILVPEIGLTPQLVSRLEARLGTRPAVLHSSRTDHERLSAWRAARRGAAPVVLGTRSAVFTPLKSPGLIVVDEEHDPSFKQQEGLRYSARDLAIARAKRLDVPVVLGSATPSLESQNHAAAGAYHHLTLTERAGGAVPPLMRLVDLNRFPCPDGLSAPLIKAIESHIRGGRQVLIFLNRRGFAPTLICQACGHIAECQRCDSRMTVHQSKQRLCCHHCGAERALDNQCSECGAQCVPLGQGTERVEEALRGRFPEHTVTRIDSDSTRLKGTMDKALAQAHSGESKILVGTQLLSKGHHFSHLGLVGVINADHGLFSTDFRGSERLAQGLVQVSGRAGREREQGEVIVQTSFPKHPFWRALLTGGYHEVARLAAAEREASGWPPFSFVALIRASAHQREHAFEFLDEALRRARAESTPAVRILGPVAAPMAKRAGRYRGQLLIQSHSRQDLHTTLRALRSRLGKNASARRVRWSIDVDPIELF